MTRVHPLGTSQLGFIFHGNPAKSCRGFTKNQKCEAAGGARGEVRGSAKSEGVILFGP